MAKPDYAEYVGNREDLKGQKALVRPTGNPDVLLAQFDNLKLVEAHGWHKFPVTDFQLLVPIHVHV